MPLSGNEITTRQEKHGREILDAATEVCSQYSVLAGYEDELPTELRAALNRLQAAMLANY